MAKAVVHSGICGFVTEIETSMDGDQCRVAIRSTCPAVEKLGAELTQVDPFKEISFRRNNMPVVLQMGFKHCTHAACPVPVGIIKAVEVEAGLALPEDVSIKISRE